MPIIDLVPKNNTVEDVLAGRIDSLRGQLKTKVPQIWKSVPRNDVIVNLKKCPFLNSDPDASDFVVYLETCPGEEEESADELCKAISEILIKANLTDHMVAEVWPRFMSGPWCMIKRRRIVDNHFHNRPKDGASE